MVRPAWAHSWRCKFSRELVAASEVKRNCMKATECGEEAWSVNREPMNKNRIEGAAEQGEWAMNHEALVTKAKRRRCGGCAMKECGSYLGTPRHSADHYLLRPTWRAKTRMTSNSRTARCGPACRVVWQGRLQ